MAPVMEKTKTAGVYKRGGRYVVTWRHRGKPKKEFFATYAEAREAKGQRTAGDRRPTTKIRFGVYFEGWIETYAGRTARGFSETTRPEYRRSIVDHALPLWDSWKLSEVEPADVRGLFGAMRRDGQTTSQIKKVRAALSALFATAVEDGLLKSNPVAGTRIPAPPETDEDDLEDEKAKALTRAELKILIDEIDRRSGRDWVLFFDFLWHTGLRISEAIGLRWEHLELTGPKPRVLVREQLYRGRRKKLKSKSGKRDLPLSPQMVERLLERRRDHYGGPQAPVFATSTGTPLSASNVLRRILAPAAIAVGLSEEVDDGDGGTRVKSAVSFHAFRHTCASMLFARGRNVKQVSVWLGHSDPGFTLRTYVHLMDEGVGDAGFFDEVLSDGGEGWATGGQHDTHEQPQEELVAA
jgi:integrase